jgi:hypothetical protein
MIIVSLICIIESALNWMESIFPFLIAVSFSFACSVSCFNLGPHPSVSLNEATSSREEAISLSSSAMFSSIAISCADRSRNSAAE